jgi:hypothetical protein
MTQHEQMLAELGPVLPVILGATDIRICGRRGSLLFWFVVQPGVLMRLATAD